MKLDINEEIRQRRKWKGREVKCDGSLITTEYSDGLEKCFTW